MTKNTLIPNSEEFGLLQDAVKECTDLRDYIRGVQVKIDSMEGSAEN